MPTLSLKMPKEKKKIHPLFFCVSSENIKAFFPQLTIFHSILSYYDKWQGFLVGTKSLTYANIFVPFQVQGLNYLRKWHLLVEK